MSTTSHAHTERDVRDFFDQTLSTYLSFWDGDGVLHTGYFADDTDDDYRAAAERTSDILAADAMIDDSSFVLDVGCGCGNFLIHLARRFGCRGEGLDLSVERVKFAREALAAETGLDIGFRQGSVIQMPYETGTFSHVVSQDALCLVPDKPSSHREIHRVLRPGGIFAFSDFLQPKEEIGERARKHVYDRVRWNSGYSFVGYQAVLQEAGFEILLARNLESHIRQTYRVLGRTATERAGTTQDAAARDWMLAFAESCAEIQVAIDDGEFGWGMFVTRKPGDATS
ncbi:MULTISPECIES: class I SAM-dependent methyltransferase [unclassified Streptosporangium]|uniref:class I SAM-dependent methyltransferase n=1 Tax=unclassified Streptosporangium TaxID=2632669 RepID=UPI002E2A9E9D|nr:MULTISPECIES: methyltransferase domain-containing protein [unclassified Streptosporangium]